MLILPREVRHSADLFSLYHPLFLPGNNSSREAEKAARSYDSLFNTEYELDDDQNLGGSRQAKSVLELEEDFM